MHTHPHDVAHHSCPTRNIAAAAVRCTRAPCSPAMSAPTLARSLAEAFTHRSTAHALLLSRSPDLRCVNIMCEKVGRGCGCRLALSLERMTVLTHLDVSHAGLDAVPDAVWGLAPRLQSLNLAGNGLTSLSAAGLSRLTHLAALDVSGNPLRELPWRALAALPALTELTATGLRVPLAADRLGMVEALREWRRVLQRPVAIDLSFDA